jgi:hypothetical protein
LGEKEKKKKKKPNKIKDAPSRLPRPTDILIGAGRLRTSGRDWLNTHIFWRQSQRGRAEDPK